MYKYTVMKKMTYPTIDEVRETFIDINMDRLLDMYDDLKNGHEDMGFMNEAQSSEFVHVIVESLIFNDTYNDHSSDDES
jgi:hypothetical protein